MEDKIEHGEGEGSKNGFVMINNNFLNYWSGIIGPGPSVLYMDLLSYCYGKKNICLALCGNIGQRSRNC